MSTHCVGCGRGIATERAELGYTYCTAPACQAAYRRGPAVTAVAVNKSGDAYRLAESDVATPAVGDAMTGTAPRSVPAATPHVPSPRRPPTPPRRARPSWTPAQEKIVRLYAEMGLSPRRIAERARQNTPRLGVTEELAVRILSAPRR